MRTARVVLETIAGLLIGLLGLVGGIFYFGAMAVIILAAFGIPIHP
jgi:hypothetical protein